MIFVTKKCHLGNTMLRKRGWLFRGSDEKDQRGQNDKLQALIADGGGTTEVSHRLTISQLSPPVIPFCHTCHPLSHMIHNHMLHLSYLLSAVMSFCQYCQACHQWSFSSHLRQCWKPLLSCVTTEPAWKLFAFSPNQLFDFQPANPLRHNTTTATSDKNCSRNFHNV